VIELQALFAPKTPQGVLVRGHAGLEIKNRGARREGAALFPEMGVFAPPSPFFMNVQCVGETEILVEQQPPQGVSVCDHAGFVINKLSQRQGILLWRQRCSAAASPRRGRALSWLPSPFRSSAAPTRGWHGLFARRAPSSGTAPGWPSPRCAGAASSPRWTPAPSSPRAYQHYMPSSLDSVVTLGSG